MMPGMTAAMMKGVPMSMLNTYRLIDNQVLIMRRPLNIRVLAVMMSDLMSDRSLIVAIPGGLGARLLAGGSLVGPGAAGGGGRG